MRFYKSLGDCIIAQNFYLCHHLLCRRYVPPTIHQTLPISFDFGNYPGTAAALIPFATAIATPPPRSRRSSSSSSSSDTDYSRFGRSSSFSRNYIDLPQPDPWEPPPPLLQPSPMAAATADYVIDGETAAAAAAAKAEVGDFAWGSGVEAGGGKKGGKGGKGKGWDADEGGLDVDWLIPGGQLVAVGLELEVLEDPGVDMFQVGEGKGQGRGSGGVLVRWKGKVWGLGWEIAQTLGGVG